MRENKTNPTPELSAKRAAAGRKGGRKTSAAKAVAVVINGTKGGRPPKNAPAPSRGEGKGRPKSVWTPVTENDLLLGQECRNQHGEHKTFHPKP